MEEKITIRNWNNEKIVAVLDKKNKPIGLAVIMPGLSGHKEQPHIQIFKKAFDEKNFTTLVFDPGNSCGESYGKLEDATVTQYLHDLEDVIMWASKQEFYNEQFILAGHSLGSFCSLLYAEKFPNKIIAIAPISTVVNGKMNMDRYPKDLIKEWKEKGIREWKSHSGEIKRLKWRYIEDGIEHDTLKNIAKITMPCLLIVGEKDIETPVSDNKLLYGKLKCEKEIRIIKGAEHTFREKKHLEEIKNIILKWIEKISE